MIRINKRTAGATLAAFVLALAVAVAAAFVPFIARPALRAQAASAIVITNPYEGVNFATAQQYKASLHVHTTPASGGSDGGYTQYEVAQNYDNLGYDFIAITDHNVASSYASRGFDSTNDRGLVIISGNEYSGDQTSPQKPAGGQHHIGSLFNTTELAGETTSAQIASGVVNSGGAGRFVLHHPGRTTSLPLLNHSNQNQPFTATWYKDIYLENPEAFGMEVYNQQNRYPNDRAIWDRVLLETFPARPVWGLASDDLHGANFFNAVIAPLEERTESALKGALDAGAFFATSFVAGYPAAGNTSRWAYAPKVSNITVDTNAGTITVAASQFSNIQWITGDIATGTKIIAQGVGLTTFNYLEKLDEINQYVRPLLINVQSGITCETVIQPFGVFDPAGIPGKAPTITAQPQSANAVLGETANFTVTASSPDGGTLSYQWYGNNTNSKTGGTLIPGAASATYGFTADASAYPYYYVIVTNTLDEKTASVVSNPAALVRKITAAAALGGVTAPVGGQAPEVRIDGGDGYTATLVWQGVLLTFDYDTAYTARITLKAKTGFVFEGFDDTASIAGFTVNGIEPVFVSGGGEMLVFNVTFAETGGDPGGTDDKGCGGAGSDAALAGLFVLTAFALLKKRRV
ncbi:MAG: hypothetical protein FWE62_01250 [Firmicutes bacterium]|nr:hypothetical protein [Bacillota bacterium]